MPRTQSDRNFEARKRCTEQVVYAFRDTEDFNRPRTYLWDRLNKIRQGKDFAKNTYANKQFVEGFITAMYGRLEYAIAFGYWVNVDDQFYFCPNKTRTYEGAKLFTGLDYGTDMMNNIYGTVSVYIKSLDIEKYGNHIFPHGTFDISHGHFEPTPVSQNDKEYNYWDELKYKYGPNDPDNEIVNHDGRWMKPHMVKYWDERNKK